jgi:hypothetical protein
MTVKELKEKLANAPDNMEVFICQNNDEYALSLSERARVEEATFSDGDLKAKDKVFVIED